MNDETTKTVRVRIEGRVQGVWFRGWIEREARARGLSGWVRNRFDGSVEAVFHGSDDRVDEMISLCWQGPPAAIVDSVRIDLIADLPPPVFVKRSTV